MTIIEVINQIDALKPNNYSQEDKIKWLSTLDGIIKREIIDTHEGAEAVAFESYNEETPLDTVLLVAAPYDDIYLKWLEVQIDYANADYGKYANSMIMYNNAYETYSNWYNRNYMPKGKQFKYF